MMTKRIVALLATLFVIAQMSPAEGQTLDEWLDGPDAEELTGNGIIDKFDYYLALPLEWMASPDGEDLDNDLVINFNDFFIWVDTYVDSPPATTSGQTLDEWLVGPDVFDYTGEGEFTDLDYYIAFPDQWFGSPYEGDIDQNGTIDFDDFFQWAESVSVAPPPPPLAPTVAEWLVGPDVFDYTGEGEFTDLDYYIAFPDQWFGSPYEGDIDQNGTIDFDDFFQWADSVSVPPPPPPLAPTVADWLAGTDVFDHTGEGDITELDYYIAFPDQWFGSPYEGDIDQSGTTDFEDFIQWAESVSVAPPPPPSTPTVADWLAGTDVFDYTGEGEFTDLDYYIAFPDQWFGSPYEGDIDQSGTIDFEDFFQWAVSVSVVPPPPPTEDVLEFAAGLVEDLFPDSGTTILRIGTPPPVVVLATTEFVNEAGDVVDPATIALGTDVSAGVWWASEGESEAYKVYVGEAPLSDLPLLSFKFGGFETLADGREAMVPEVAEFVLGADVPVGFDGTEGSVPFSAVVWGDLLGHEVELWFVVDEQGASILEEVHVYALEEVPDPYWDMFVEVYAVNETTCSLVLFHEPFLINTSTEWINVDPNALAEGTELVIEVNLADHSAVRVQLREDGADYSHLFTGELGVYFGGFVSFDGEQLRVFDAEVSSPVALDLVLIDDATGNVTTGGLADVSGFVRARVLHPQPGAHLPFNLLIEIGLNADPDPPPPTEDVLEFAAGLVEDLFPDSGTTILRIATPPPVVVLATTEFVNEAGDVVDPATIALGTDVSAGVWWRSEGESEAYKVYVGEAPLSDLPLLSFKFGGFETLPDGREAMVPEVAEFVLGADVPVGFDGMEGSVPFSAVVWGDLLGHEVELWFVVDEQGASILEEVHVYALEEVPDPYWDMFVEVYAVNETTCSLVLFHEPFLINTSTEWINVDPNALAEGTELVIEVNLADHSAVRVQLREDGADYSHLFTGELGVYFGGFVSFDGEQLRVFDAEIQTPVSLDLVLLDDATGDVVAGGFSAVAGFVRARVLHPQPGPICPSIW